MDDFTISSSGLARSSMPPKQPSDNDADGMHSSILAAAIGLTSLGANPHSKKAKPKKKFASSTAAKAVEVPIDHRSLPPNLPTSYVPRLPVPKQQQHQDIVNSAAAVQLTQDHQPTPSRTSSPNLFPNHHDSVLPLKTNPVVGGQQEPIGQEKGHPIPASASPSERDPSGGHPSGRDQMGGDNTCVDCGSFNRNAFNFPEVLYKVISNEREYRSIISWLPNGRGFNVLDKQRFALEILPRHFEGTKYTSFTRRLKRWKFLRVSSGPEIGAYYNKNFVRGKPELVSSIMYGVEEEDIAVMEDQGNDAGERKKDERSDTTAKNTKQNTKTPQFFKKGGKKKNSSVFKALSSVEDDAVPAAAGDIHRQILLQQDQKQQPKPLKGSLNSSCQKSAGFDAVTTSSTEAHQQIQLWELAKHLWNSKYQDIWLEQIQREENRVALPPERKDNSSPPKKQNPPPHYNPSEYNVCADMTMAAHHLNAHFSGHCEHSSPPKKQNPPPHYKPSEYNVCADMTMAAHHLNAHFSGHCKHSSPPKKQNPPPHYKPSDYNVCADMTMAAHHLNAHFSGHCEQHLSTNCQQSGNKSRSNSEHQKPPKSRKRKRRQQQQQEKEKPPPLTSSEKPDLFSLSYNPRDYMSMSMASQTAGINSTSQRALASHFNITSPANIEQQQCHNDIERQILSEMLHSILPVSFGSFPFGRSNSNSNTGSSIVGYESAATMPIMDTSLQGNNSPIIANQKMIRKILSSSLQHEEIMLMAARNLQVRSMGQLQQHLSAQHLLVQQELNHHQRQQLQQMHRHLQERQPPTPPAKTLLNCMISRELEKKVKKETVAQSASHAVMGRSVESLINDHNGLLTHGLLPALKKSGGASAA
jgi:hypothetical protein